MLAQVKQENGKYTIQVYRTNKIVGHKTWQTIAESRYLSIANELKEYICEGGNWRMVADMRGHYLRTHRK